MILDPWSAYRLATPGVAISQRSGVPGVIDHLADEPAGETPGSPNAEQSESISDIIRRRRAELQKKVDEIMGNAVATPVPTTPPGMSRQKRLKCQGGSKVHLANISQPCCGNSESSTQTEVSLPHIMRDVLWTASSLDPIVDFEDDNASIVIETHAEGPSVLDIDSIEVAHHDDADDLDETDEFDDAAIKNNNNSQEPSRTPKKQKKKMQRQRKKIEKRDAKGLRYSPLTSVPALTSSLAGREPREGSRVESSGVETVEAGVERMHDFAENSFDTLEVHSTIDTVEVHSTIDTLEVHSTTHLDAETSDHFAHFRNSPVSGKSIQSCFDTHFDSGGLQSGEIPIVEQEEDQFECPECWRQQPKSYTFTTFVRHIVSLPFCTFDKQNRYLPQDLAKSRTGDVAQEDSKAMVQQENLKGKFQRGKAKIESDEGIESDENLENGEGRFLGDSSPGATNICMITIT